MAGMLRVSRSRGALSGVLLVLLGIWGGLVPLVGPYVNYAYTPNHAWRITSGRVWLEILPAAGALLGGLILLASKLRPTALFGASLAAASGAWFAVGPSLAPLWTNNIPAEGYPVGSHIAKVMEQIGFFTGLGVVIVCIAAVALGRLSQVSVRDRSAAERTATTAVTEAEADREAISPTGGSRWPGPLTASMRRVASSSRGEKAPEPSEPVSSSSSSR
jgi:hypothetical protein